MIGFAIAGLYSAALRRPVSAGFCFGLALAVKATAAIALPFALLLIVRPDRSLRLLLISAGWLMLGWAAGYAGVVLVTGLDWMASMRYLRHLISVPVQLVLTAILATLWWRARGREAPEIMWHAAWALVATVALAPFRQWYWLWPLVVIAAADPGARWPVMVTAALAFEVLPDGYGLDTAVGLPGELALFAGIGLAILESWQNRMKFATNAGAARNCPRRNRL
jgi:alpha-1,6-mannosyltransferase